VSHLRDNLEIWPDSIVPSGTPTVDKEPADCSSDL